jgi:hypothetical protein
MREMLLFLVTSSIAFANAQTLDRLDNNNGFRKFKFGMAASKFDSLKTSNTSLKLRDVKFYDYLGKDISEFYGVRIEGIALGFYQNHLYQIQVSFGTNYREYSTSEFALVQTGLEANFGHLYHECTNTQSPDILSCAIWDASRVRVESLRLNLSERDGTQNKMFNYVQGYMLFTEKDTQREQQQSEIEQ